MKKRYLTALGLVVFCGCVALGVPALSPVRPGVTKECFDRIQIGMKKADVEAILGGEGTVCEIHGTQFNRWSTIEWTRKDNSKLSVDFYDDRVSDKSWAGEPPENGVTL
jgi:hypothetical protein